jgi:hypothetical protein
VSKVRAFLEGYRTSEVRRLARETAAMLLDKIVEEGVDGLDVALATMTRSSDDYATDHAGELNDSLLEYLSDAIRQQEAKVQRETSSSSSTLLITTDQPGGSQDGDAVDADSDDTTLSDLWEVQTDGDGHRVESIDPNDPKVRQALHEERAKQMEMEDGGAAASSASPSEQLLLLLQLLKKRIEAEAAFVADEKGRNLRLLAYCLRLPTEQEWESLILKETGTSMDVRVRFAV